MSDTNRLRGETTARRMRFMIGDAHGAALDALVPALEADDEIRIVNADNPKLLVVEMTDAHAKELQKRHAGRLIIERDAPLTPFE
jgi:hypothetical protein